LKKTAIKDNKNKTNEMNNGKINTSIENLTKILFG